MRPRLAASSAAAVALALLTVTACAPLPAPSPSASPLPSSAPPQAPTPTPTPDPIAGLTLEQQVGQLFVVGTTTTSANPVTLAAVRDRHVGGIFLHSGTSTSIAAAHALVGQFTAADADGIPLWVSTDQEGGEVQVLAGAGFDAIPEALQQGALAPDALRADATTWGAELAQAGVNLNLAPVADIVTSAAAAPKNAPIGALHREYGFDEATVAAGAGAFAEGMRAAGVAPTFKHFPGLGRTTSNTDFSDDVIDDVVDAQSPDVDVYRTLLAGGPAVAMVSTAIYRRIDASAPAAFSPTVVTELLRGTLGWDGVVITDDLSAAKAVSRWTPGERATMAIDAGCDLVLASTDPGVLPAMYDAVLAKARSDPAFAAKVDAAARRVVALKSTALAAP